MAQIDDGIDERAVERLRIDVPDEGAIDLHDVCRRLRKHSKRRIPRSEIIHGKTDSKIAQPAEDRLERIEIRHKVAFRHLENKLGRIDSRPSKRILNETDEIGLEELQIRDVDVHDETRMRAAPFGASDKRLIKNPPAYLADEPV